MSVTDLVRDLRSRGIRLRAKGDQLVVQAAAGALTADIKERIARHKPALLALLGEAEAHPPTELPATLAGMAEPGKPPLSPAQRRFWHLQRIDPAAAIYNLPGIWRLKGPLDVATFRDALQAMVDRHDILRSRFTAVDGQPVLTIADVRVDLPVKDFSGLPAETREAAMGAFIEATIEEPIDLEQGPPFRAILIRLAPDEHAIFWMPHSIVWDGWSFDILLQEFSAHYRARLEGGGEGLPPLPIQFADFAAWQNQRLERGEYEGQLNFWRRRLAGPIASIDLPTDRERTPALGYDGARVWSRIDGPLLESMRELARVEGVTTYMVMLAALNALLHRYSQVRDVLVASPLQGRLHPQLENLVGVFVNTLFFRTKVDPAEGFRALLHRVRDTCLEAVEHQDVPSDLVIEAMEEGGLRRTPYEMIFIYQQATARVTEMGPVTVQSVGHGIHHVAVDLVMWSREHPQHIDFGVDYRTSLFDEARIRRMVEHLKTALASAAHDVTTPVGALEILGASEIRELASWSTGPEATAVAGGPLPAGAELRSGPTQLRDGALDEAMAALRACAAASSGTVALLVDGTPESALALAMLGETGSGALLLPPGLPAAVVDELCARAGAGAVLTAPGSAWRPTSRTSRVPLRLERPDGGGSPLPNAPQSAASLQVPVPDPEGGWTLVDLPWESLRQDAGVLRDVLRLKPGTGVALYSSGSPEQFASAVLAVLASGGRLVLPNPGVPADGWDLEEWVSDGSVEVVVAGPRTLRQLADTGWQARVATVFSSDPLMPPDVLAACRDRAERVVAGWGMVEAGTWALIAEQADLEAGALGRPAAGTSVAVTDPLGQVLPVGIPGELRIRAGLGRGSQGKRFGTRGDASERMFRTGERVRWSGEGRLMPDGHVPGEAILDGRRVAFADIEAALRLEPAVRDSHVAVQVRDGQRRLTAVVAARDDATVAPGEVRARLRERLGDVLVPDAILVVGDLARRTDGTIDEARLAGQLRAAASPRQHAEPRSEAERAVADAWREALNVPRVGLADNFFELGGHSLLAVQVTLKLAELHGLRIDPRSLYFQTLEQVAAGASPRATAAAPAVAT